jgi:multiple sugar transport system permease protein
MTATQGQIAVGARRDSSLGKRIRKTWPGYLFILPGFLFFLVWTFYPLARSFVMSFFEWNLIKPSVFIGADNYTHALNDPIFWIALGNTLFYVAVTVPGQMILGLGIAVLLSKNIWGRDVFRVLYYLPVITSWVVVSLLFIYLFNNQAGLINYFLRDVFHVIDENINWLGEPANARWAIASLGIWKGVGWTMIMFLAGLQAVDVTLYEAAAIDGASGWQSFRRITLPLIRRTTLLILILLTIGAFQVFISVYVMTGGGPLQRTEVLLTYAYNNAFKSLNLGYGAALSYIFAAIVLLLNIVQLRGLQGSREE